MWWVGLVKENTMLVVKQLKKTYCNGKEIKCLTEEKKVWYLVPRVFVVRGK